MPLLDSHTLSIQGDWCARRQCVYRSRLHRHRYGSCYFRLPLLPLYVQFKESDLLPLGS
jgi:hypothetical protein